MSFSLEWSGGSVNDCIIQYAKDKHLSYQYDHFGRLQFFIGGEYLTLHPTVKNNIITVSF